jgi:predicted TIM-barrel fold metal-dependent hydrolase
MTVSSSTTSSAEIRIRLGHPVIDVDGHTSEFIPALAPYLREVGISTDFNALFRGVLGAVQDYYDLSPAERRRQRVMKPPWWTRPMRLADDRAASCFPRYLRSRMDELGCDVSVIYPSTGLAFFQLRSEELRRGACRALNRYHRDAFDGCTDRLIPVAVVPASTPREAIEELEYAVLELGYRAVVVPSYVPRPVPGFERADASTRRWAFWIDTYGIDSDYDYDPFWQRCTDLGVSIGTHSQGNDIGFRRSPSNWVYNHIGHFSASGEALCKSLFLGGVTRRFPRLRVALLEGGVGWACSLYSDLVAHWQKRNVRAVREILDPRLLDVERFRQLAIAYGSVGLATSEVITGSLLTSPGMQTKRPNDDELDEFAALDIEDADQIKDLFVPNFYFGCEADDPMNAVAFQRHLWPQSARLNAMYGSDISHFDVPVMADVLVEAYENIEDGRMSEEDFKDFVFTNPVRFYTDSNPEFFNGTVLAAEISVNPEERPPSPSSRGREPDAPAGTRG